MMFVMVDDFFKFIITCALIIVVIYVVLYALDQWLLWDTGFEGMIDFRII